MEELSKKFGEYCLEKCIKVVTAESCTAGLIGATIAMTSGSSRWLDRGFIVYTPEAKNEMLGVSFKTISSFNITSNNVAEEMAIGALNNSVANLAIAVTGVAGPTGGTAKIPVGTVCMAWATYEGSKIKVISEKKWFSGSRNEIRESVVKYVLEKIMEIKSDDTYDVEIQKELQREFNVLYMRINECDSSEDAKEAQSGWEKALKKHGLIQLSCNIGCLEGTCELSNGLKLKTTI